MKNDLKNDSKNDDFFDAFVMEKGSQKRWKINVFFATFP